MSIILESVLFRICAGADGCPAFLPFSRCGLSGWNAGALARPCLAQIYACALGCGCRYKGTPHRISQYRTSRSLHPGADPDGGILTHNGT